VAACVNLAPKLPAHKHPPLPALLAHPSTLELLLAPHALAPLLRLRLAPPPLRVQLGRPVREHRGDLGNESICRGRASGTCDRAPLYIPSPPQVVLQVFAFCLDSHRRRSLPQHAAEALALVSWHVARVDT
tara:strand:- start:47 stop:439 length:393 start_codon:yes stop_codon:yes gene_type:complete